TRRNAAAVTVRMVDQERLARSASRDMYEFLQMEESLWPVPCPRGTFGGTCILRRGRPSEPIVFIDEGRLIGGFDQLATYRPSELYAVEVFAGGLELHAYTHAFMERAAWRPVALMPLAIWLGR